MTDHVIKIWCCDWRRWMERASVWPLKFPLTPAPSSYPQVIQNPTKDGLLSSNNNRPTVASPGSPGRAAHSWLTGWWFQRSFKVQGNDSFSWLKYFSTCQWICTALLPFSKLQSCLTRKPEHRQKCLYIYFFVISHPRTHSS